MAYLSINQLEEMGFSYFGKNIKISDKTSFYNCSKISIGDNVRIDDFCVLSAGDGGIELGNHIHIAVFVSIIGAGRVTICDFGNISSRVSIYSSNDDYSGDFLTNPTVPAKYTNVNNDDVYLGRHALIGSGSVILPGVTINDGAVIGALSFVNKNCEEFTIYAGVPAKRIKDRGKDLLNLEKEIL